VSPPCEVGVTYEAQPPTLTSDRDCQPVQSCRLGETYELQRPTLTSDRECTAATTCDSRTEYDATRATLTSDRVCGAIALPRRIPPRVSITGAGAIISKPEGGSDTQRLRVGQLRVGTADEATVEASHGRLQAASSLRRLGRAASADPPPQERVALLAASSIHSDEREILVAVQLLDDFGGAADRAATPSARHAAVALVPDAVLKDRLDVMPMATCAPPLDGSGVCIVGVSAPPAWFSSGGAAHNATFTVQVGPNDGSFPRAERALGRIAVREDVALATLTADVAAVVPTRRVRPGETVTLTLVGEGGGRAIRGWEVGLEVASGLTITSVSVDETWSAEPVLSSDRRRASIVGIPADPGARPQGQTDGTPEALAQVSITADTSADAMLDVDVIIYFLSNVEGTKLTPRGMATPVAARVVDFAGAHVGPAQLRIVPATAKALFPYTTQGEVVNTAAIDRRPVAVPLGVVVVNSAGDLIAVAPGDKNLSCVSVTPGRAQVDADCSHMRLSGREQDSGMATWRATYAHSFKAQPLVTERHLTVWLPSSATIVVADPILSLTEGWAPSGETCSSGGGRYQRSRVSVNVTFTSDGTQAFSIDATALIAGHLVADDAGVVAFVTEDAYGPSIEGVSPGATVVRLAAFNGQLLGETPIQVDDACDAGSCVRPVRLDVYAFAGISVTPEDASLSLEEERTLTIGVSDRLEQEFQTAQLVGQLLFSDNSTYALPSRNFDLRPTGSAVVVTSRDGELEAREDGQGVLALANWTSPAGCLRPTMLEAPVELTVALPAATAITVRVGSSTLAPAGSSATLNGIRLPSSTAVEVIVTFQDGTERDLSTDGRLNIASDKALILEVSRAGEGQAYSVGALGPLGRTNLSVSFDHLALTASLPIEVVDVAVVSLFLSPYPLYAGSLALDASPLNLIAGTGQRQQGAVSAVARLTSGIEVDISSSSDMSFSVLEPGTVDASSGVLEMVAGATGSGGRRVFRAVGAGSVDLVAIYGAVRGTPLRVSSVDERVQVEVFTDVSLPSTLRGQAGVSTAGVRVGVRLTDKTSLPLAFLFPTALGGPSLPNLLTFSVADTAGATVNANSGVLLLQGNLPVETTVTITAIGTAVSLQRMLACNLDPAVNDGDIGSVSGVPIPQQSAGSTFTVNVRINVGSSSVRTVKLAIDYDENVLEATGAVAGSGWPGGQFLSTLNDPPGRIAFGGASNAFTGTVIIAKVTFRVVPGVPASSLLSLQGVTLTLADADGVLLVPAEQAFVAGDVDVLVRDSRRRRSAADDTAPETHHVQNAARFRELRRAARPPQPQRRNADCVQPEAGDTDGNCIFDLRDATFARDYLARVKLDSSYGADFAPHQLKNLDIDSNGERNADDAAYLASVDFRLYRFFTNLTVAPVSNATGCLFTVEATLLFGGDNPTAGDNTALFVDLDARSSDIGAFLDNAIVTEGLLAVASKGSSSGRVFQAALHAAGGFRLALAVPGPLADIGISLIIVTLDSNGATSAARTTAILGGSPDAPFTFPSSLRLALPLNGTGGLTTNVASEGYNPLVVVSNGESSRACNAQTECPADSYVSQAATPTSEPVCSSCSICADDEFITSECQETEDRACEACDSCGPGLYAALSCTESANTVCASCTMCSPGTFVASPCSEFADTDCQPCRTCGQDEYEATACSAANDTVCQACSICSPQEYEDAPCEAETDTACVSCTQCDDGEYVEAACSANTDAVCQSCSTCTAGVTFASANCSAGGGDTICAPCSSCAPDEFEAEACMLYMDTQCRACSACGPNEFVEQECAGSNDTKCSLCSTCDMGSFQVRGCTPTADTTCRTCSMCNSTQYERASCSAETDTDCRRCSLCAAGEFVSQPCSTQNDTQCSACSTCDAGTFALEECSAVQDTMCANCSTCGVGEYEAAACTATNDTVCLPCADCGPGEFLAQACSPTADAVCASCSVCAADEFEAAACSLQNDTICEPCGSCSAGQYALTPCTATANVTCQACSSCEAEEYITSTCAGANDTVCALLTVCAQDEIVAVPATATSDRVCEPAEAGLPPPVTFETSLGLGFWLDEASQTVDGITERPLGAYLDGPIGSSGTVAARLGDSRATAGFSRGTADASRLEAVVSNAEVWHDAPEVTVWVQVYDSRGNAQARRQVVRATLSPSGFASSAASATCQTSSSSGQCAIRINVPASYFSSMGEVRRANVSVILSGGSGDGVAATLAQRSVVVLRPRPLPTVTADVLQAMPFANVYVGDSFTVSVLAQGGGFALSSWRLRLSLPESGLLSITGVSVDKAVWSESVTIAPDGQSAAVTAGVADALSRPQGEFDETEALCEVTLRVQSGAATDRQAPLLTEIVDLFNSRSQSVVTTPQEALSLDRFGQRRGAGQVFIAADVVVGLLARPSTGELVNIAAVGGDEAVATVAVCGVSLSGRRCSTLSSGLSCSGSDDAALSVAAGCSRVSATSAASRGSGNVQITAVHAASGSQTGFAMRVWYPQSPVELSVSDRRLSPISGWRAAAAGCSEQRQTADISVYARLEAGGNVIPRVGLTSAAASSVASSAASVAGVDAATARVLAVSAGNATLQLQVAGSSVTSNAVVVSVVDDTVAVESLEVTVVSGLTLNGVSGNVLAGDGGTGSAVVGRRLTQEFERADVYVRALLADGRNVEVTEAMGLELESLNKGVLRIVNETSAATEDVEAIGSGQGLLLSAVWRDISGCPGGGSGAASIASGLGFVDVRLPRPDRAVIVLSSSTVVPADDPAAALPGVVSSATMRVFLEFPSGRQQEMTRDARTLVNVTNLALSRDGSGNVVVRASSASALAGTGTVSVAFTHENVTATASVVIATLRSVELSVHPFPRYPGSRSFDERVLSPIAGTGVMQRAELVTFAELSTGARTEVSNNAKASYSVSDGSLFEVAGVVLSVASGAALPGSGTVTATFNGVPSAAESVQVSDQPVTVVSIDDLTLPATLTGQRNTGTAQATCGVTLSDTTRWTSAALFPGATLALGNLLRFDVSETSAATTDADSGLVTLVDNWYEQVSLRAEAIDSGVDATRAFTCNLAPTLGDVDVGATSGVPVPPVGGVGSEFAVNVRVQVGGTALRSVQLTMTYPPTLLSVIEVTRGSDWPGGPFESNDDTPGVVSFGGASDAVTGTPVLATVRFRVVSEGIAALGGVVTTLADVDGNNIGTRVGLAFDAGMVPVRLGSGRRRRGAAALADAGADTAAAALAAAASASVSLRVPLQRGRRAESCSPKPCSVCPETRQTGDTDGDCLFDVRDVTFLRQYLNLQALDPMDPGLQDILPVQAASFDVDGNGRNNTEDFAFLLKVNFGLYHFVRDLEVMTVEESGAACRLSVSARLVGGGAGLGDRPADGNRSFVYFDVESQHAALTQQLAASVATVGSRVSVDKGADYNGGLWRAAPQSGGRFLVEVASMLNVSEVGLSLIQGTLDADGRGLPARTTLMTGDPVKGAGFLFEGSLAYDLEVNGLTTVDIVSEGYNPRVLFSAEETSLACQREKGCGVGEYLISTATVTTSPVCANCSTCGVGEYEAAACTATNDTVCLPCADCGPGEFAAVPCQGTQDTVCAPLTSFVPPVTLSFSPSASLQSAVLDAPNYNGSATRAHLLRTNVPGGAVAASVGGVIRSQTLPSGVTSLSPVSLDYALSKTSTLYSDGRSFNVLLRVRNANGGVLLTPSRVVVARLQLRQRGSNTGLLDTQEVRCTPSLSRGTCQVVLTAPQEWFTSASEGRASFTACFADDSGCLDASAVPLESFSLAAQSQPPADDIAVVTTLPQRDVFPGATMVLPVSLLHGPGVASFALRVSSSSELELIELRFSSEWSPVYDLVAGDLIANALLSRPESIDASLQAEIRLCEIVVRVRAGAAASVATVSVTLSELIDANSNQIAVGSRLTNVPSSYIQRGGFFRAAATGDVHITRAQLAGMFVDVVASEVMNFGSLSGAPTEVPLQWTTLLTDGSVGVAAPVTEPALQCDLNDTSLASVLAGCSGIQLTQLLATGGPVRVQATAQNMQDEVGVYLLPFEGVRLEVGLTTLARIEGLDAGSTLACEAQFQATPLLALATLRRQDGTLFEADVTRQLAVSQLASDNPTTASVEVAQGVVRTVGRSPGSARIRLMLPVSPAVTLDVSVTNATVSLDRLDLAVVAGIDVGLLNELGRPDMVRVVAVPHGRLVSYSQSADVYVSALYSDGTREDVTDSPRVSLRLDSNASLSLAQNSQGALRQGIRVIQAGTTALEAAYEAPTCAGGRVLARGSLLVVPTLPNASGGSVRLSTSAITRLGDPAACAGTATSARLAVELMLNDGARLDITSDPTLTIDLEGPLGVRRTVGGAPEIFVVDTGPAAPGVYRVTVTIPQLTNATRSASLTVLGASALRIFASPSPTYPGSSSATASPLNPIARTGVFQEALVDVQLTLAPTNASVSVSGLANLSLADASGTRFVLSPVTRILSVVAPADDGSMALLRADLCGLAAPTQSVSVSLIPVEVDTFDDVSFPDTFGGLLNSQIPLRFGVTLTDGTRWTAGTLTGAGSGPTLPNLVNFTSADPSRIAIDGNTGVATLLGSSPAPILLSIRAPQPGPDATTSIATTANVAPAVGDVDLGKATRAPVEPVKLGSRFTVAVRVNSGSQKAGAVELAVQYDPTQLRAISARSGSDWAAGAFIATLNDPPGVVLLGGTPTSAPGVVELGLIEFEAIAASASTAALGGEVVTLATDSQIAIGGGEPRAFVAGDIVLLLEEQTRRRRRESVEELEERAADALSHARIRRATRCSTPPCATCDGGMREAGDVNGDCVFDVNDVTYLQRFLLLQEQDANAAETLLAPQRNEIDADGSSGPPTTQDAFFLLRVNFRQLRFVRDVVLEDVSDQTNCTLRLRARVSMKGDAEVTDAQTAVFFVLESTEGGALDSATEFVTGEAVQPVLAPGSERTTFQGVIWRAEKSAGDPNVYEAAAQVPYAGESIGVSIVQVTTDADGASIPTRQLAMTGTRGPPFTFPDGLRLLFPLPQGSEQGAVVFGSAGYNPLRTIFNGISSDTCAIPVIPSPPPPPTPSEGGDGFLSSVAAIVVFVILGILACFLLCCITFCCRRRMPRDEETGLFYTRSARYDVQASNSYRTPARGGVTLLRQGVLNNDYHGVDPGYKHQMPEGDTQPLDLFTSAIEEASAQGVPEVVPPVVAIQETGVDEVTPRTPVQRRPKPLTINSARRHLLEAADGLGRAFVTNPFDPLANDPNEDLYSDDEEPAAQEAPTADAWGAYSDVQPLDDETAAGALEGEGLNESEPNLDPSESFREVPEMESHNRQF
jgi:hypothetical protein